MFDAVAQKTKIAIPFVDLKRQYLSLREKILHEIDRVLSSGNYILGEEVDTLEREIAAYLRCPFVVTVANGTDALILVLKALGVAQGDEVILPVNSFIATAGAVVAVGATPVLCDIAEDLNIDVNKIESLITSKTKVIMPVHLTGRPAEMNSIMRVAKKNNIYVVEDAAQSIGAHYHGAKTGTLGDVGCFSLHPLKNWRAYGDAGFITMQDETLYREIKLIRNHGLLNRDTCVKWGLNSRLDAVQAGILRCTLPYVDAWNARRREIASNYQKELFPLVKTPCDISNVYSVYHNFIIQTDRRDELMRFLEKNKIETKIHYPIPIHLQAAASKLAYRQGDFPVAERITKTMMSLPVYPELTEEEVVFIIKSIQSFFTTRS